MTEETTGVLVCGGGPAGMMLGLLLHTEGRCHSHAGAEVIMP